MGGAKEGEGGSRVEEEEERRELGQGGKKCRAREDQDEP